jgi:radical SAM protein with 4Fe4S-binding SPASM domain
VDAPSPGDQSILDIEWSLFHSLCNELKEMNTKGMVLLGEGEPFLHPRLFDMIASAKEAGFHVTCFTNGTLLNEASVQSLMDSRLDVLKVSLWASSHEEYERNYPGTTLVSFKRTVEGLKLLSLRRREKNTRFPSLVLHQPINRYNFQGIDAMVDLAHATGCDGLLFSPLKSWRGELDESCLSKKEEELLRPSLILAMKRLNALSIDHNMDQLLLQYRTGEAVWEELPCYTAWFHSRIKVDGTVLPCYACDLPMGNLRDTGFQEIWNNSSYRTFRKKTLSRKGLASMGKDCDCGFCCHVVDNMRVHRFFRWISPFVHLFRREQGNG